MSELNINADLNKAVLDAVNSEDIRQAVIAEAAKQGFSRDEKGQFVASVATQAAEQAAAEKVAADKAAADTAAAAVAAADEAEPFTRTENIGGRDFTFEAATELELERMVNNAYKVAVNVQQPTVEGVREDPAAAAAAKAAAEQSIVDKAELELKFKRGEITADAYLEQSGAVKTYLEKQGVPLDELKRSIEDGRSRGFEQSWADATQDFLKSAAGRDWPGGDKNLNIIGLKLQELGLVDAEDKVAALAQAYASMRQTGVIFPYEAPAAAAKTPGEIAADKLVTDAAAANAAATASAKFAADTAAALVAAKTARTSSSMFGQSSGVSAPSAGAAAPQAKMFDIPATATPAEILAAWHAQQVGAGIDPNEAFKAQFAAKK